MRTSPTSSSWSSEMPLHRCSSAPPGPEEPELLLAQAVEVVAVAEVIVIVEVAGFLGDAVRSLNVGMLMRMPLRLQEEPARDTHNSREVGGSRSR